MRSHIGGFLNNLAASAFWTAVTTGAVGVVLAALGEWVLNLPTPFVVGLGLIAAVLALEGLRSLRSSARAPVEDQVRRPAAIRGRFSDSKFTGNTFRGFDTAMDIEGERNTLARNTLDTAPVEPPFRIRLADPPDDTKESHLDWAHISVTNDTDDDVPVSVMGSWGDKRTEFEWENANDLTVVIPRRQKRRFAFVVRLRAGSTFRYRQIQFDAGVCYVCDRVFHNSDVPGATLPPGRHQFLLEAYPKGLPVVTRRFDVYVPIDNAKSLWVVPRGRTGND